MAATGRPGLMPALLWTNGRFTVGLGAGTGVTKGEEPRSAPGRAGDGAGDRRQARIGRAQPVEAIAHHRDGVALALILANQHRAGLEVTAWPVCCRKVASGNCGRTFSWDLLGSNNVTAVGPAISKGRSQRASLRILVQM